MQNPGFTVLAKTFLSNYPDKFNNTDFTYIHIYIYIYTHTYVKKLF